MLLRTARDEDRWALRTGSITSTRAQFAIGCGTGQSILDAAIILVHGSTRLSGNGFGLFSCRNKLRRVRL